MSNQPNQQKKMSWSRSIAWTIVVLLLVLVITNGSILNIV